MKAIPAISLTDTNFYIHRKHNSSHHSIKYQENATEIPRSKNVLFYWVLRKLNMIKRTIKYKFCVWSQSHHLRHNIWSQHIPTASKVVMHYFGNIITSNLQLLNHWTGFHKHYINVMPRATTTISYFSISCNQ